MCPGMSVQVIWKRIYSEVLCSKSERVQSGEKRIHYSVKKQVSFLSRYNTLKLYICCFTSDFSLLYRIFNRRTKQCPKILQQSVAVVLFGNFLRIQTARYLTNSSKWFRWQVTFQNEHTFVNTPCSHLQSFCATGASSGLATKWPWLECNGRYWDSLLHGADHAVCDYCCIAPSGTLYVFAPFKFLHGLISRANLCLTSQSGTGCMKLVSRDASVPQFKYMWSNCGIFTRTDIM
jgi:hypothetical protein